MRWIFGLFAVILLVFSTFSLAQNIDDLDLVDAGTTPDSFLYGIDLALENIGLALTFSNSAKIEKNLRNAEERLSEVREMALENKIEAMARARNKLDEISDDVKKGLAKIDDDDSNEQLRKELRIENKIKNLDDKVDRVENEVKIKLKIEGGLTEEQKTLITDLINSFEGKVGELNIEIRQKKDKTKIKIKQKTGRDGDEVESELEIEEKIRNKIKVEIEDGETKINLKYGNVDEEYILDITDNEEILNEIASRLNVSVEEIRDIVKFDIEGDGGEKVEICHVPRGNGGAERSIEVNEASISAHLKHGDRLGECDDDEGDEGEDDGGDDNSEGDSADFNESSS